MSDPCFAEKEQTEECTEYEKLGRIIGVNDEQMVNNHKIKERASNIRNLFKKDIHDLIKVRNSMIKNLKVAEEFRDDFLRVNFDFKQMSRFFNYCKQVK
jgi:hypothetical protein